MKNRAGFIFGAALFLCCGTSIFYIGAAFSNNLENKISQKTPESYILPVQQTAHSNAFDHSHRPHNAPSNKPHMIPAKSNKSLTFSSENKSHNTLTKSKQAQSADKASPSIIFHASVPYATYHKLSSKTKMDLVLNNQSALEKRASKSNMIPAQPSGPLPESIDKNAFLVPQKAASFDDPSFFNVTIDDKIKKAADSDEWLALVHFRPFLWGQKSSVDSDNFFLATDGKTNPQSELKETLSLFQGPFNKKQCLFPARYQFLKKQNLLHTDFPTCTEYDKFKQDLNPAGVTIIYTDAYMNNPSSLFGHTLLRIDIPEGRTQLVAHGVNYGAFVDSHENGVLFAVYGLTGGYFGGWTVKPYYDIINMYNNMENRDIWEFKLNLTPSELDYFVAHLWELGHTQTRYYFFTKNCSYLLMEFLDAVRPSLKLADDFPLQTIPLDTLKAVQKRSDLIKDVTWRPSRQKRIMNRYNQLSTRQKQALIHWIHTSEKLPDHLSGAEKAAVLDTAYEYVQYQWEAQHITLRQYRNQSFGLLRARRDIPDKTNSAIKTPASPLTAHNAIRLTVSEGWRNKKGFQELTLRPAYHSLTDRKKGLLPGAEINFLNTKLRHYDHKKTVFQGIDIVEITSISTWNALFKPISYNIKTSVNRDINLITQKEGYVYHLTGGAGMAVPLCKHVSLFGFLNTSFQYGGFMPHTQGAGIGPYGGLQIDIDPVQILITGKKMFSDNYFTAQTQLRTQASYAVTQNVALAVSYDFSQMKHKTQNELKTTLRFYF